MLFGESGHVCCWLLTTCFNCSNSNRDEILSPSHLQKTFEVPGVPFITFVLLKKEKERENIARGTTGPEIDSVTCISCIFGHQVAQLGLVQHLVIRWRHLHCLQSWPPGCVTCIATLPWIALLALSVSIELVSSSARVTSVKSQQGVSLTDRHPDPKIGPQVYLGPIKMGHIWCGSKKR